MARKDELFRSFLEHELIIEKYGLEKKDWPDKLRAASQVDSPIIEAIALIVENLELSPPISDKNLRTLISQYLNSAIS